MKKRILSLLLALVMLVGVLPTAALAADGSGSVDVYIIGRDELITYQQIDLDEAKPFATGMSEHCLIRRDDFKPVSMKKAVPELYERYKAALEPDYQ